MKAHILGFKFAKQYNHHFFLRHMMYSKKIRWKLTSNNNLWLTSFHKKIYWFLIKQFPWCCFQHETKSWDCYFNKPSFTRDSQQKLKFYKIMETFLPVFVKAIHECELCLTRKTKSLGDSLPLLYLSVQMPS